MAAPPRSQDVLDFLASNGFSGAASALRSDILSRGGGGSPHPPPPVRTAPRPPPPRACSVASSSSDAFVSIGSSPSGLVNPYGLSSPSLSRAESEDSSDREFGTAREYYGEFNLFGETRWYDDDLGNPYASSTGGVGADDKFVMTIAAEERFGREERRSCAGYGKGLSGEMNSCLFALCDCHGGQAAERAGKSKLDLASVYGRYRIMPDETERLDECSEDACQLKRIDEHARAVLVGGDAFLDLNQMGQKRNNLVEKEFQMLSSYTFTESNLANNHPTFQPKIIETSSFPTNTNEDKVQTKSSKIYLINEKDPQRDANGDPEIEENAKHDGKYQDAWALGLEGEDHGTADELQLSSIPEDEYEIFHLRIIHRKNRTGFEENKDLPIILNSIIAGRYLVTEYLGSAAFSKVVQAHDLHTGVDVCLKIIKNDKDFFDQSLDEIKLLKYVNKYDPADEHHLLRLYDYFYYQEHLFIVCELLRANLYEFQKYNQDAGGEGYFTLPRIQAIARQCLEALEYLHDLKIIHCDLKPENILIKSYSRCEIKIIDLGSSCFQTDNLCLYVQSRSYRAPEVILGLPYSQKIDIWSLGCVLAELYIGDVLFPNESLVMMLARMVGILGPIDIEMLEMGQETHKYFTDDFDLYHKNEETDELEYLIPEKSSLAHQLQVSDTAFVDFLGCLLQINPKRRPTANQALQHRWFSSCQ